MKTLITIAVITAALPLPGAIDAHGAHKANECRTSMLAGRWLFATGIGHQQLGAPAPPTGDITAIGTMNIDRQGRLEGKFDVTFEGAGFLPGVLYAGEATLNEDCTGTLTFVTSNGTARTDSIAVVERDLFWGMSQDPNNLWTYRAKKISNERVSIED